MNDIEQTSKTLKNNDQNGTLIIVESIFKTLIKLQYTNPETEEITRQALSDYTDAIIDAFDGKENTRELDKDTKAAMTGWLITAKKIKTKLNPQKIKDMKDE